MKALLKGLFLCVTMHTSAQHIDPLLVLGKTTPPLFGNMQEEVYEIINQTATKYTEGDHEISSDSIKQILGDSSKVITHLFNSLVDKEEFPEELKVARISPILKPGKIQYYPKVIPWSQTSIQWKT